MLSIAPKQRRPAPAPAPPTRDDNNNKPQKPNITPSVSTTSTASFMSTSTATTSSSTCSLGPSATAPRYGKYGNASRPTLPDAPGSSGRRAHQRLRHHGGDRQPSALSNCGSTVTCLSTSSSSVRLTGVGDGDGDGDDKKKSEDDDYNDKDQGSTTTTITNNSPSTAPPTPTIKTSMKSTSTTSTTLSTTSTDTKAPTPKSTTTQPTTTSAPALGCTPASTPKPSDPAAPDGATPSAASGDIVFLNVYDVLTPSDPTTIPRVNDVLMRCGLGIFHTGVEVWGREFAFGGHATADSGIFEVSPRQCPSVRYRTTLCLGRTGVCEQQVEHIVHVLGMTDYLGLHYSLISRNCNTFSAHLAALLGVDDRFPSWVNRLAGLALNLRCILPEPLLHPVSDNVPAAAAAGPLLKEPQKPPKVATL